jgi:hypothetical protein
MINYIVILVILLIFNFKKKSNSYIKLNEFDELNEFDDYKNSIWKNTELYDDISKGKINIKYKKINPNLLYNPNNNLDYYNTIWSSIETIPNDYLSRHNDKIKIIYNPLNKNKFQELIQKRN